MGVAMAMTSCSDIDESERLLNVDKPGTENPDDDGQVVTRKILIEDFTGQKCINCPKAADIIEQIQNDYGADNVIAVGIHSGAKGFHGTANLVGLATDTGDEYYQHWGIKFQPAGLVNRVGGILIHEQWMTAVHDAAGQKASLSIEIGNNYNDADRTVTINVRTKGVIGNTEGKLQVWAIEDNIVAMQKMPDGSTNREYVHKHVFRTSVNDAWGDNFSIAKGEEKTATYTLKLDGKWVAENVSIVAFVYNGDGVQQVEKKSIK